MVDAISTSLSGLNAATERVRVASNNIANAGSTGRPGATGADAAYIPQDIVNLTDSTGGVQTQIIDRDPATQVIHDPGSFQADENGQVAVPNVHLDAELITIKQAEIAYRASLDVIKVAGKMQDELLKTFDEKV